MYIVGFVIPGPEDKKDAYIKWAQNGAAIYKDYGCQEIVEAWEDTVPDGQLTDYRRAVNAKPGEKIVLIWQIWPDKDTMVAAETRMRDDPRMEVSGEIPFDAKRLIYGTFNPLHVMGRD
jgi:uncharacterized protein YbaA (DUF1428 family)